MKLANTWNSLAVVQSQSGQYPQAEDNWKQASKLLEQLTRDAPEVADHHKHLGIILGNVGWLRSRGGDYAGAQRHFADAIAALEKAATPQAASAEVRQALRNQWQNLAECLVQTSDHAGAVAAAERLAGVFPDRALDHYYAACFVARAVPLVDKDGTLDDAKRRAVADRYADQALTRLRDATRLGAGGVTRLPNEKDIFRPLERFAELPQLLRELGPAPMQ